MRVRDQKGQLKLCYISDLYHITVRGLVYVRDQVCYGH